MESMMETGIEETPGHRKKSKKSKHRHLSEDLVESHSVDFTVGNESNIAITEDLPKTKKKKKHKHQEVSEELLTTHEPTDASIVTELDETVQLVEIEGDSGVLSSHKKQKKKKRRHDEKEVEEIATEEPVKKKKKHKLNASDNNDDVAPLHHESKAPKSVDEPAPAQKEANTIAGQKKQMLKWKLYQIEHDTEKFGTEGHELDSSDIHSSHTKKLDICSEQNEPNQLVEMTNEADAQSPKKKKKKKKLEKQHLIGEETSAIENFLEHQVLQLSQDDSYNITDTPPNLEPEQETKELLDSSGKKKKKKRKKEKDDEEHEAEVHSLKKVKKHRHTDVLDECQQPGNFTVDEVVEHEDVIDKKRDKSSLIPTKVKKKRKKDHQEIDNATLEIKNLEQDKAQHISEEGVGELLQNPDLLQPKKKKKKKKHSKELEKQGLVAELQKEQSKMLEKIMEGDSGNVQSSKGIADVIQQLSHGVTEVTKKIGIAYKERTEHENDKKSKHEKGKGISRDSSVCARPKVAFSLNRFDSIEQHVDFDIPPLHQKETVRTLTKHETEEFIQQGINIRSGRYTKKERETILKNWADFVKQFGIDDLESMLGVNKDKTVQQDIRSFIKAKHFYVRLAKGLDSRTLCSVYKQARSLLLAPIRKVKLTSEEIQEVKRLQSIKGNDWNYISEYVDKPSSQCSAAAHAHDEKYKKGGWSHEENEKLKNAVYTILDPEKVKDMSQKKIKKASWVKIAALVQTRNYRQCRIRWMESMGWTVNPEERVRWGSKAKSMLIYLLHRDMVDDEALINWKSLFKHFSNYVQSYSTLMKRWRKLKCLVPSHLKVSYQDTITYLFKSCLPKLLKESELTMVQLLLMIANKE